MYRSWHLYMIIIMSKMKEFCDMNHKLHQNSLYNKKWLKVGNMLLSGRLFKNVCMFLSSGKSNALSH